MGLDVGVVTIEYMSQPKLPVYDFLFDLLLNPYTGSGDEEDGDEEIWGGAWADNGLYEFGRARLTCRAVNWATDRAINSAERADLLSWIAHLPWRDDRVMLHLGR